MEYELVNPSDPYTFLAKNHEVAVLVVFLIDTRYGANPKDAREPDVPLFLFGGSNDWYQDQFGYGTDVGLERNAGGVADALESMMLGTFSDRARYEAALKLIDDPEKKELFRKTWQENHSSLNDIGTRAHHLARSIREVYGCGREEEG